MSDYDRPTTDGIVVDIYESEDPQWMFELLGNPAFSKVPPNYYTGLLERFSPLPVKAGDVLVRQGDPGDFFYFIRQGRALVTRRSPGGMSITLDELGPGQCFGEDALLSGDTRNATVSMKEDGLLMRLSEADFRTLLREPLVHPLTADGAIELMRKGAQLVDVRSAEEFKRGSLKGAINLPLFLLRVKLEELDRKRPCVLFCDDGRRSSTAAFILVQRGFDAHVLLGGLSNAKKTPQPSPETSNT